MASYSIHALLLLLFLRLEKRLHINEAWLQQWSFWLFKVFEWGRQKLSWCVCTEGATCQRGKSSNSELTGVQQRQQGSLGPAPLRYCKLQKREAEDGPAGGCSLLVGSSSWPSKPNQTIPPPIKSIFIQVSHSIGSNISTMRSNNCQEKLSFWVNAWAVGTEQWACLMLRPSDFGPVVNLDDLGNMCFNMHHLLMLLWDEFKD